MGALEAFGQVPEYYPGSNRQIVRDPRDHPAVVPDIESWDHKPRVYPVNGVDTEFFTTGHLAVALGRKPGTMRKWEISGIIPKATFNRGSKDPRGRRRLYSREQVEGMIKIAQEEGVLRAHAKPIKDTDFTKRVLLLFRELSNR